MAHNQATNFRSLAAHFVFGSVAPALATLAFFGLHLASAAFAYVVAIVPAPMMGSLSAERHLPSCRWRASIGFRSADLLIPDCNCSWWWPASLADLVDVGAEQPGSRRQSHHPKCGEQGE